MILDPAGAIYFADFQYLARSCAGPSPETIKEHFASFLFCCDVTEQGPGRSTSLQQDMDQFDNSSGLLLALACSSGPQ